MSFLFKDFQLKAISNEYFCYLLLAVLGWLVFSAAFFLLNYIFKEISWSERTDYIGLIHNSVRLRKITFKTSMTNFKLALFFNCLGCNYKS